MFVVLASIGLAGCGKTQSPLTGTWTSGPITITFDQDGGFVRTATSKLGPITETGVSEIDGDQVTMTIKSADLSHLNLPENKMVPMKTRSDDNLNKPHVSSFKMNGTDSFTVSDPSDPSRGVTFKRKT